MEYQSNLLASYTDGTQTLIRGVTEKVATRMVICNSTAKNRCLLHWEVLDHAEAMRIVFADTIEVTYGDA